MQTPLISNGNASVCTYVSLTMKHVRRYVCTYVWLFVYIPFTCSCCGCLLGCNWWSNWSDSDHCGVLPSADVVSMCNSVIVLIQLIVMCKAFVLLMFRVLCHHTLSVQDFLIQARSYNVPAFRVHVFIMYVVCPAFIHFIMECILYKRWLLNTS